MQSLHFQHRASCNINVTMTNKMHILFPPSVSVILSCTVHVSNKQVHHLEITSFHAAYSFFMLIMLRIMWISGTYFVDQGSAGVWGYAHHKQSPLILNIISA
jgi:hypothetical protein